MNYLSLILINILLLQLHNLQICLSEETSKPITCPETTSNLEKRNFEKHRGWAKRHTKQKSPTVVNDPEFAFDDSEDEPLGLLPQNSLVHVDCEEYPCYNGFPKRRGWGKRIFEEVYKRRGWGKRGDHLKEDE
ncbi:hypothetical protein HELRODRAFT_180699 [Helobdella robusta]|uniref:Uncharacterized protein n=1 Tax=Helobdella robusta TaxID=6412 RepID=T1FG66_HELRO|nr:hypothetical protein HELRODRAFT_180699 [Helobdella robusta]ESN93610.1 hypothetical protein HELRODRAFT_180699 [Helobdella robusta]